MQLQQVFTENIKTFSLLITRAAGNLSANSTTKLVEPTLGPFLKLTNSPRHRNPVSSRKRKQWNLRVALPVKWRSWADRQSGVDQIPRTDRKTAIIRRGVRTTNNEALARPTKPLRGPRNPCNDRGSKMKPSG